MVISKTKRPSYTYEIIKSNTTASIVVNVDPSTPYTTSNNHSSLTLQLTAKCVIVNAQTHFSYLVVR